jgi:Aldehyde dehydrogenase family
VKPADRARLLRRLAALVEEHGEELAKLESANVGKPLGDARWEVGMVADVFHFYSGAIEKHNGETIPVGGGVDLTFREPLGVVGLIVPWNFPLMLASWKLGVGVPDTETRRRSRAAPPAGPGGGWRAHRGLPRWRRPVPGWWRRRGRWPRSG